MSSEAAAALADAVVVAHFAFVLFVLLGGLPALRWRRWPWVHLPAAAWGAAIEWGGWICPLTQVENWLRRRSGDPGYATDFVAHYVAPVLYPAGLTREIQIALGFGVVAINLAVYAAVWRRRAAEGGPRRGHA